VITLLKVKGSRQELTPFYPPYPSNAGGLFAAVLYADGEKIFEILKRVACPAFVGKAHH
jgi:hypothetical protein